MKESRILRIQLSDKVIFKLSMEIMQEKQLCKKTGDSYRENISIEDRSRENIRGKGHKPDWNFVVVNKVVDPLSQVQIFVTPWSVACQAPLSMGFSTQVGT